MALFIYDPAHDAERVQADVGRAADPCTARADVPRKDCTLCPVHRRWRELGSHGRARLPGGPVHNASDPLRTSSDIAHLVQRDRAVTAALLRRFQLQPTQLAVLLELLQDEPRVDAIPGRLNISAATLQDAVDRLLERNLLGPAPAAGGMPVATADARTQLESEMRRALGEFTSGIGEEPTGDATAHVTPTSDIMQLLVDGDALAVEAACRQHLAAHGSLQRVFEMLQQCMYDIGNGWAGRRLGVADEHVAHATARLVVARIDPGGRRADASACCVVACPSDEGHDFGTMMLRSLLLHEGWDVRQTGERTPAEAIAELVLASGATDLVLSATLSAHLPEVARTVELTRDTVEQARAPHIHIAFGGQASRAIGAPEQLGVDLVTSSPDELIEWMHPRLGAA